MLLLIANIIKSKIYIGHMFLYLFMYIALFITSEFGYRIKKINTHRRRSLNHHAYSQEASRK